MEVVYYLFWNIFTEIQKQRHHEVAITGPLQEPCTGICGEKFKATVIIVYIPIGLPCDDSWLAAS